ncbi:hypothetical protein GUJ93_ZPchr0006g41368 [Zizania palustris]|uniref:Small nuclear ribonucleoprotein Sm D3 n=1 Tax=Zizania palustris TaxID=103762 RepID=A0A8J5SLB6_ZIZPA|nr:hypothetical protein GUJ93_ZPchr0006g41368 [Zizania palustris]
MSRSLGIPVKLLHEAAGHVVTVELKTGEVYRGSMLECEDNWNCQLDNITFTAKDGKVSQLEHVFIRGSRVRFMIIPDMLKNAPMFKRLEARIRGKGSAIGVGRGRAVAMRARVIPACFVLHNFKSNLDSLLLLPQFSMRERKQPWTYICSELLLLGLVHANILKLFTFVITTQYYPATLLKLVRGLCVATDA